MPLKTAAIFVEYYFEKPGKGVQPKLSYAKQIPGTDIFIGTGVYIDNVEEEKAQLEAVVSAQSDKYKSIAGIVFGAIIFISIGFAYIASTRL